MDVAPNLEGTGVPTCLGSVEHIDLVHLEAHAHHGVLLLPWAILDVRGGDDGTVGQQLHPGVAAITASVAMQEGASTLLAFRVASDEARRLRLTAEDLFFVLFRKPSDLG